MKDNIVYPLLEIRNVKKAFGRVIALNGVSFDVQPGELVGLLGDNGAGKSTLIKLIVGIYEPDEGEILFQGKSLRGLSPGYRRELGIETVPQGGAVVPYLDVARNFFLGREILKTRFLSILDLSKMHEESARLIAEMGIRLRSTYERVSFLSGGERQVISIARTLYFKGKLILLDEPTLNLSVRETDKLLEAIALVKNYSIGIIFVTHNVYHVFDIADKFVILNRGNLIGVYQKNDVTPNDLITCIRTGNPI